MPEPLYTRENIEPAYQLNWTLTVFWRKPPFSDGWLTDLQAATEADGVRILSHRFSTQERSQFLISTTPDVRPIDISARVKGRLQHVWKRPRR